jgi:L-ascorbate metabolism protein UlaG (beta-lactamase superfamily)
VRIRRLGWAGLELEAGDQLAVVDLLQDTDWISGFGGEPRTALPGPSRPADLALVTHLHADHADPASLKAALKPGAPVLRPAPAGGDGLENAALELAEAGLRELDTRVVEPWETVEAGPFRISAIPAADGTGDPQVSWVVADDETTLIHCGDTLFHGWWWRAALRAGPFDAAFLPINGAVLDFPWRQPPSPLPGAMTPEEAAVAAQALSAQRAVPMHFGAFDLEPYYRSIPDALDRFLTAAGDQAYRLEVGEELALV